MWMAYDDGPIHGSARGESRIAATAFVVLLCVVLVIGLAHAITARETANNVGPLPGHPRCVQSKKRDEESHLKDVVEENTKGRVNREHAERW